MTGSVRTCLDAHTSFSNPFLPCNIDGRRRLSSMTVVALMSMIDDLGKIFERAEETYDISP